MLPTIVDSAIFAVATPTQLQGKLQIEIEFPTEAINDGDRHQFEWRGRWWRGSEIGRVRETLSKSAAQSVEHSEGNCTWHQLNGVCCSPYFKF